MWEELNDRQRTYLDVLFRVDQNLEAEQRQRAARGQFTSAPARAWRRIDFNNPIGPVRRALEARGVYDSGAGATLAALRKRGLIDTETMPGVLQDQVSVWLTRAGRAAVRAGTGATTPARPPKGLLSERLWRQLATVARALHEARPCTMLDGQTHLHLAVGYEQYSSRGYLDWHRIGARGHYVFTDLGTAHYREHHHTYRRLYPGVDAPELPAESSAAASTEERR